MTEQKLMQTERMLHKANQIALNFAAYPRAQAVGYVADHIKKFWTPVMRQQIAAYVDDGGQGLHELVMDAVKALQDKAT